MTRFPPPPLRAARSATIIAALFLAGAAHAQAPLPAAPAPAPSSPSTSPAAAPAAPSLAPPAAPSAIAPGATPIDISSLAALSWLEGCWRGSVNQREFRERWLPLRGGLMLGASHNVLQDKTLDYEYLRLESRADGIHYLALPSGMPPTDFRLTSGTTDERGTQFVFTNVTNAFPQRLVYHRGAEGWLYASIEGTSNGEARTVTFPMRRVNCESGELLRS